MSYKNEIRNKSTRFRRQTTRGLGVLLHKWHPLVESTLPPRQAERRLGELLRGWHTGVETSLPPRHAKRYYQVVELPEHSKT